MIFKQRKNGTMKKQNFETVTLIRSKSTVHCHLKALYRHSNAKHKFKDTSAINDRITHHTEWEIWI